MYSVANTPNTVTLDLLDLLNQADQWLDVAAKYATANHVGVDHAHAAEFLGRAEGIILIMPLSMDDRCWRKYHEVQARARNLLAVLKDVAWASER